MTPTTILNNTFGYTSFRPQQEEIIQTVLDGNDVLVIMPTGGGKSLCYQIPALALDGMAVVVSPLIALMDDQVSALKQMDIKAETLHSNLDPEESSRIVSEVNEGNLDILYISPERLLTQSSMRMLSGTNVCLFAIDEAHCVSVW